MKLIRLTIAQYQVHVTLHDIFKVVGSKVKVTDNMFSKMHFSGRGICLPIDSLPSKTTK